MALTEMGWSRAPPFPLGNILHHDLELKPSSVASPVPPWGPGTTAWSPSLASPCVHLSPAWPCPRLPEGVQQQEHRFPGFTSPFFPPQPSPGGSQRRPGLRPSGTVALTVTLGLSVAPPLPVPSLPFSPSRQLAGVRNPTLERL